MSRPAPDDAFHAWNQIYGRARWPSWMMRWAGPLGLAAFVAVLTLVPMYWAGVSWSLPALLGILVLGGGAFALFCELGPSHAEAVLHRARFLLCPRCARSLADSPSPGSCWCCGRPFEAGAVQEYWRCYLRTYDELRRRGNPAE